MGYVAYNDNIVVQRNRKESKFEIKPDFELHSLVLSVGNKVEGLQSGEKVVLNYSGSYTVLEENEDFTIVSVPAESVVCKLSGC